MEELSGQVNGSEAARQAERLQATREDLGRISTRVDAIEAVLTAEKPSRVIEWITVAIAGLVGLGGTVGWLINFVIEPLDRKIEEVKLEERTNYADTKKEREFLWSETEEAREGHGALKEKVLGIERLHEERFRILERDLDYIDSRISTHHGEK